MTKEQPTATTDFSIVEELKTFVQTILPHMIDFAVERKQMVCKATLSIEEAATYLGIHKDTVRKLIREKVIPHSMLAGRILLRASTLDEIMDKLEAESIAIHSTRTA